MMRTTRPIGKRLQDLIDHGHDHEGDDEDDEDEDDEEDEDEELWNPISPHNCRSTASTGRHT
jgi:ABC-type Zn2+ transport system substrate-binding protein/surface adhesin